MHALTALRAAVVVLACSAACAQAEVIFEQAPNAPATTAWTSHFGIGLGGFQMLDNFRVNRNATIDHVSWRGTYFDNSGAGVRAGAPNTDTWTVEFWSGNAAGPLTQLYSQDYAASDVVMTSKGTQTTGGVTFDLYDFNLDLTLDFDVVAGQSYWFSVMSKSSSFNPVFSWLSSGSPGNSWQRIFDGNGRVLDSSARAGNRAFTLESTAVPEPASLALVAGALLAGGLAGSRRKAASAA